MDKEYLVKKWLANELSEEEVKAFKALDDAKLYEEISQEATRFKGNLQAKVIPFEVLETRLYNKNRSSLNWVKTALKIAAIFIVGFALFMLIDNDHTKTFKTDYAQNETIILPDNSTVKLNQLSQLIYNPSNWNEERILELTGEAFFDVEKGKRFDVNTEFGKVSVLGTEFNVTSRDSIFKVSCYEGLVQVLYDTKTIKLPAGSEFTLEFGIGQKSNISIAEPYWLKNMSVFENASIDDVLAELEKQYDISINYESNNELHFTGAFEHNSLENALKAITQTLNLTYKIETNKEVIIRNAKD